MLHAAGHEGVTSRGRRSRALLGSAARTEQFGCVVQDTSPLPEEHGSQENHHDTGRRGNPAKRPVLMGTQKQLGTAGKCKHDGEQQIQTQVGDHLADLTVVITSKRFALEQRNFDSLTFPQLSHAGHNHHPAPKRRDRGGYRAGSACRPRTAAERHLGARWPTNTNRSRQLPESSPPLMAGACSRRDIPGHCSAVVKRGVHKLSLRAVLSLAPGRDMNRRRHIRST